MPNFKLILLTLLISTMSTAQIVCNQITADMGYSVQSVTIRGRWVSADLKQKVEKVVGLNNKFDPENVNKAIEIIRTELVKSEGQTELKLLKGATSALYIYSNSCDVTKDSLKKEVSVEINPFYLRIDLYKSGNNILPIPRSAKPSFYGQVPALLKATAPLITFFSDRQYGPGMSVLTSTDFLHLPDVQHKKVKSKSINAILDVNGEKSFSNNYYKFGNRLEVGHQIYTSRAVGWKIELNWSSSLLPLGNGQNLVDNFALLGGIQGVTNNSLFRNWTIGAGARSSKARYTFQNNILKMDENAWQVYATIDGKPGKSFTRLGIWFDGAEPDHKTIDRYQRLVSRVGFSQFIGAGHNNALIEAVAGAGYTWGSPPMYSQFFAGNSNYNFLYQSINSSDSRIMKSGPIVRGLGENEGGITKINGNTVGGSSFWHFNLNFSVPIPGWSKPLIPDVTIFELPSRKVTLRSSLKGQAVATKTVISTDLIDNHGFSDDEADSIASAIVEKDIHPTLNYLADHANVYAIKPVLLFDVGQLRDHSEKSKTFTAAGVGIQINVVIARFEIGYMQMLSPHYYQKDGNFFLRLVLENFY